VADWLHTINTIKCVSPFPVIPTIPIYRYYRVNLSCQLGLKPGPPGIFRL
jgi:hypothetical protein